jgi:hypothetical protein
MVSPCYSGSFRNARLLAEGCLFSGLLRSREYNAEVATTFDSPIIAAKPANLPRTATVA